MKFIVERTADWDDNLQWPLTGMVQEGTDHWGEAIWSVELQTLAELLMFKREAGHSLIIRDSWDKNAIVPVIEIYNGYRE